MNKNGSSSKNNLAPRKGLTHLIFVSGLFIAGMGAFCLIALSAIAFISSGLDVQACDKAITSLFLIAIGVGGIISGIGMIVEIALRILKRAIESKF